MRFNAQDPARHFYRYAFRWTELFERVIDPLRRNRSLTLSLPLLRLSDDSWYEHLYDFHDASSAASFGGGTTWPSGSTARSKRRYDARWYGIRKTATSRN